MKQKWLFGFLLMLVITLQGYAQCPTSVSISTVDVVAATCPSNGKATVNSSGTSGTGGDVSFQLTAGPASGGYTTTAQDDNVFNDLPPGNYTVTVKCKNGTATATKDFTITSNYTPLGLNFTTQNVCTSFTPAGIGVTATATGGSGTLQYALLKTANAGEPDGNFTYGASNTFSIAGTTAAQVWGTYQLRVKDACGAFVTKTVELQPNTPTAKITQVLVGSIHGPSNALFGSTNPTCGKVTTVFRLADYVNNNPVTPSATTKYKIAVWESNTTTCPATTGTPAWEKDFTAAADLDRIPLSYGTRSIAWRIITGCGEETTGCTEVPAYVFNISPQAYPACGASGVTMVNNSNTLGFPITVEIKGYNAAGTELFTSTSIAHNQNELAVRGLQVADHYTVKMTDACALSATRENVRIHTGNPALATAYMGDCTSVIGTGRLTFGYASMIGNVPGWGTGDPSTLRVVNTVTNQEWTPQPGITWSNSMSFYNVPPGTNYVLRFTSADGCTTDIPFTVAANSAAPLTDFTLGGTSTQTCTGSGSISSTLTTNYAVSVTYRLFKDGATTQMATNGTGNFSNLTAGAYKVVAELSMCGGLPPLTSTKEYTILPDGENPVISKKYGYNCDAGGTGVAGFQFIGAGPFLLEMKKTTEPETAWATIDAAAGNEKLVTGLVPNTSYDVRITNHCGKSATTSVSIAPLTNLTRVTTTQPCVGQAFVMEMENLPGATYSWTRDGGTQISTSNKLEWASYQANNDGAYTCTVTINNCIVRTLTTTLNSSKCGQVLSVKFGDISATQKGNNLLVNWSTMNEENNAYFEIEGSRDGQNFTTLGKVMSKAKDGKSDAAINYDFGISMGSATGMMGIVSGIFLLGFAATRRRKLLTAGIALVLLTAGIAACSKNNDIGIDKSGDMYIRIAVTDKDGKKDYSKVVKVVKE